MTELFQSHVSRGAMVDCTEALYLLTKAYIDECGISLGYRTLVYNAGEAWQERLARSASPLAERARREALLEMMPALCDDYDAEIYDKYDICALSHDEMLSYCQRAIAEHAFDEPTLAVLCWGIDCLLHHTFRPFDVAVDVDGVTVSGQVSEQHCGCTWIRMLQPYTMDAFFPELRLDCAQTLRDIYHAAQRLEDRDLVQPCYQTYLQLDTSATNRLQKHQAFDQAFAPLWQGDFTLFCQDRLRQLYGFRFWDPYNCTWH